MNIAELLKEVKYSGSFEDKAVLDVTDNSRAVRAGSVFDLVFDVPPSLNGPPSKIVGVKLGMSFMTSCFGLAHTFRLWRHHILLSGGNMHWHLPGWRDTHRTQAIPCRTYGRSAVHRPFRFVGRSWLQARPLADRDTREASEGQY